MKRINRRASLRILLLTFFFGTVLARPISAASQAGLDLKRTHYFVDERTRVWLSVHLINEGTQAVTIVAIAPAKSGPWTKVGQSVAPGAMARCAMPAPDGGAKAVWVGTSAGLVEFDLRAAH